MAFTNENGDTLLHLAVKINNLSLAKELIQSGININACNQVGTTPLHIATSIGDRTLMIQLLLTNGANIHIFNEKKFHPFQLSCQKQMKEKLNYCEKTKLIIKW
ncbi:ankyrin repeat domain-containing protein [Spiroplasma endosymbiont of Nephrotoma flavescens]|uniref:ankyrin repeat domain-containing protein n=1 Tax=Spiroplasma endosymbiont of Nephrotoma flavescens TaxID=3066302 RepID=UPI003CC7ABC3